MKKKTKKEVAVVVLIILIIPLIMTQRVAAVPTAKFLQKVKIMTKSLLLVAKEMMKSLAP
jgi:hypothetical protein